MNDKTNAHGAENVVSLRSKPARLEATGTFRSLDDPNAVLVRFNRQLTEGELDFFNDVCGRSACLMDGA